MDLLLIGGTGTLSMEITRQLVAQGHHLTLLNRGTRQAELDRLDVQQLSCDIHDEAQARSVLSGLTFDAVADFIAFTPEHAQRNIRLFAGRTQQFIHISTAAAYQKPPAHPVITEDTPLDNPFWTYAQLKIRTEDVLWEAHARQDLPLTVVRPSHTYDERKLPLGVYGNHGSWQVARRMLDGKPVIIHGDGTSLWTMTHTRDHARGFIGLIGNEKAIGQAVHITSDESLTWNQIYGHIAAGLGVELRSQHISSWTLHEQGPYDFEGGLIGDKANSVIFDNTRLKMLVPGFKAETLFREGVRETIEHILDHPELQVLDPEFDAWCDALLERYSGGSPIHR